MFDSDLILAFLFMALLFIRQITILRQPNKINYAPLMIGIGAISSVVHFIIHPDVTDVILLLRESFMPLLVGLLLYIVMNILHQTQQTENTKAQNEFSRILVEQVTELKEFMSELEERMRNFQQTDREDQEEIRVKFIEDIKALDTIQINQRKFLEKFDEMQVWHQEVSKEFDKFTNIQMPRLDDIVHEHIDILRISEQDHYNKINNTLQKAVSSRENLSVDMDEMKDSLHSMKNISDTIAKSITKHTLQQLSGVTKSFEDEITALKLHSEGVKTSLYESDNILATIRQQSEMIMNQMLLSSKNMDELQEKNSGLHDVSTSMKELIVDIELIKADYVKSQSQLSTISHELKRSEAQQIETMKQQIETLEETLTKSIEESLSKLHEHYHIADEDITQSVQVLAKKAQLKRGYTELDS